MTTTISFNMETLNEEESFHATRESFEHLRDIGWIAAYRISFTVGETAVSAMFMSLNRDQQHAAIASSSKMSLSPKEMK